MGEIKGKNLGILLKLSCYKLQIEFYNFTLNVLHLMGIVRCPSADEWIRKLWYIYTMEYYSAIKKNAFESVLMRWLNWNAL